MNCRLAAEAAEAAVEAGDTAVGTETDSTLVWCCMCGCGDGTRPAGVAVALAVALADAAIAANDASNACHDEPATGSGVLAPAIGSSGVSV